jgi:hypothetical protein
LGKVNAPAVLLIAKGQLNGLMAPANFRRLEAGRFLSSVRANSKNSDLAQN